MLNQTTTHDSIGDPAKLLRLAADNDVFRAELEVDPQRTLAAFGLHVAAEDLPQRVTLPSKATIRSCLQPQEITERYWFGWVSEEPPRGIS